MRSNLREVGSSRSKMALPMQCLSKSLEKTFLRMKAKPSARHAYVEAEVTSALTHQIRALRLQRNWSQSDLAKRLGTTQAAVSRLEDSSYGRFSVKTLIELSKAFDTGLQVRFVSMVSMLADTHTPIASARLVPTFEEESTNVCFYRMHPNLTIQPPGTPTTALIVDGTQISAPFNIISTQQFNRTPTLNIQY